MEELANKVLKLELLVDLQKKEIDILKRMIDTNSNSIKILFENQSNILNILTRDEEES